MVLAIRTILIKFTCFQMNVDIILKNLDIWCPGLGVPGMRDTGAQNRDVPGKPGRLATLTGLARMMPWQKLDEPTLILNYVVLY